MSVTLVKKTFKRVGRVEQGQEASTYEANQLSDDSIASDSGPNFLTDVLEVTEGSLEKAREYFTTGANHHLRLEAGGYSPEEKAAKALIKALPAQFAGMDLDAVVAIVKGLKK